MNVPFIDDLIKYINTIENVETYNIVDIGCGNGRIILDFKEN